MFEGIKNWLEDRRNRVKPHEVEDLLSLNIWKTRSRIIEEIDALRLSQGEAPTPSGDSAWKARLDTRSFLIRLQIREVVEMKREEELTATETAWASKTESGRDEHEARFLEEHGYGGLCFYRLKGGDRKRKRREDDLPEGLIDPLVVRG